MSQYDQKDPRELAALEMEGSKISQKHIEAIPPEDINRITNGTQVEFIVALHMGRSDEFNTRDRMGNLPPSIKESWDRQDRPALTQAMRDFASNPMAHAKEVFKYLAKEGGLPESVRTQMEEIVLLEGKNRLGEAFASLADRLEKDQTGDIDKIWQQGRNDFTSKESDSIRKIALKQLAEAVYPEFFKKPEVQLWLEIENLPDEKKGEPNTIATIVQKFQKVAGDSSFAKYAETASIQEQLKSGELDKYNVRDVIQNVRQKLKEIVKEKLVSAGK
jgi:hypothetical protein